jgi:hypothetical protein
MGRWVVVGLIVFAAAGAMAAETKKADAKKKAPEPPPELNRKVLEFARKHEGEKVGDGQCITLAIEALRAAGARQPPLRGREDFAWGREVPKLADALPGDILQFRDAVFKGTQPLPGGGILHTTSKYEHHTAIVASVKKTSKGLVITVLHQNTGGAGTTPADRLIVQEGTLRMADLRKGGTVRAYRPTARDDVDVRDGG